MKKLLSKNKLALLAACLTGLLLLILIFSRVLSEPNSYIFSDKGDAVKSYFNFGYYLRYDKGIKHDGINYPYGEHLQYINSHPLYLQFIRLIDKYIYPVADYGVGILNLTMILSLLLAVPFLYLILRKFALPPFYSAAVALIILFLTPQFDRISGHFEMVYAFFIPLYWYLLIRWQEGKNRTLWSILLILTALTGGFTSAYYSALLMLLPFAVLLVELWNKRKDLKAYLPQGLLLFFIAVFPLIIVKTTVSLTDWVSDRPDNPWGFFIFQSNLFSIFLPPDSMLRELTNNWNALKYQWEGRAYVGFPALLTALAFALSVTAWFVQRKKPEWRYFFPDKKLNLYLFAAIIVLIFSMGIPFNWGMEFLTDLLPPLKQFRCLGRFSWIFYYVFTVYTAAFLYRFYRRSGRSRNGLSALIILLFALSYWGLEAGTNAKKSTKYIFNRNQLLETKSAKIQERFNSAGIDPDSFQAVFSLPFANTCGDKMQFEHGLDAFSLAMQCSYQTGLPIIESFSPRLSFTQAMSSIQLLADSMIYKTRVDDMNSKPILLVISNEKLNSQEQALVSRANIFWENDQLSYAILPVSSFNQGHQAWKEYAENMLDSLPCRNEVCSSTGNEKVIYEDFEDEIAENSFSGKGAKYLKEGSLDLLNEELYTIFGGSEVELSCWLFLDHRTDNMPVLEMLVKDNSGKEIRKENISARSIHNVYGLWVRVSKVITPEPGCTYHFIFKGKYITVDDLLVRPVSEDVCVKKENAFPLFNNYPLN